jgi:hypothetical protein
VDGGDTDFHSFLQINWSLAVMQDTELRLSVVHCDPLAYGKPTSSHNPTKASNATTNSLLRNTGYREEVGRCILSVKDLVPLPKNAHGLREVYTLYNYYTRLY